MDTFAEIRARFAVRTGMRISSKTAIVAITLLAAALRFALLDRHGLTSDEIFAYWLTREPWTALPHALAHLDRHPPLFYAVLKAWTALVGTGESAVRFLSACFGVGTTALTYVLARKVVQEREALLAAFLVAASPFQVMASQEARMYALLSLLVVGSTTALIAATERGGIWSWAGYAALVLLMVYTHNFGFLILLAHGLWLVIYARQRTGPWLSALAAVMVAYLPWVPFLAAQATRPQGIPLYKVGALQLVGILGVMHGAVLGLLGFGGSAFGMQPYMPAGTLGHWISLPTQAAVLAPFLALITLGVAEMRRDGRGLALVVLPPVIVLAAASVLQVLTDRVFPRVFSFLVPFYAIVLAAGIADFSGRCRGPARTTALATALVVAVGSTTLARYYFEPGFWPDDWRGAAAVIVESAAPGDFYVYVGPVARYSLAYYDREPHASMTTIGPGFTRETAEGIVKSHARLWLVGTTPYTPERPAILSHLGGSFSVADGWRFGGIWVYLLHARR